MPPAHFREEPRPDGHGSGSHPGRLERVGDGGIPPAAAPEHGSRPASGSNVGRSGRWPARAEARRPGVGSHSREQATRARGEISGHLAQRASTGKPRCCGKRKRAEPLRGPCAPARVPSVGCRVTVAGVAAIDDERASHPGRSSERGTTAGDVRGRAAARDAGALRMKRWRAAGDSTLGLRRARPRVDGDAVLAQLRREPEKRRPWTPRSGGVGCRRSRWTRVRQAVAVLAHLGCGAVGQTCRRG
jgi:hypothetical protein